MGIAICTFMYLSGNFLEPGLKVYNFFLSLDTVVADRKAAYSADCVKPGTKKV